MSNLHVKHLLVGGGLAGVSAARAIRQLEPDGSVLLVGQESSRPYHRPPLSKEFLRRQKRREELFAVEANWFEANHVELRTGRRVSRLDTVRRAATLDNGEEVSYDNLLLATGASPLPLEAPGAGLPNVFSLRTLEDAVRLHNAIDKAKHEGRPNPPRPGQPGGAGEPGGRGRATVVGAGLLGVEVAASLAQSGLAVDLLASRAYPWDKFAGENLGKFLQLFLERRGVTVHPNARPLRIEGDGRVQRVLISRPDGTESSAGPAAAAGAAPHAASHAASQGNTTEIVCDFVVACVGAAANKDVLRGTPIAAGKAILVDDHCRTNVPGVYAAGDCCALLDPLFGKHRQMDHWENARVTGALAGRNMAGADERYGAVNYFFSDVFDLTLSAWGEARVVDRRLVRGSPRVESPELIEVGVAADGRVAQVLALAPSARAGSDEQAHAVLRELVARRLRLDGNEERLKDPTFPLAELLR